MQLPVRNSQGEEAGSIQVSDDLVAVPMNVAVVHQGLVREQAGQRKGTHNTKTRSEVSGGGRKPWPQKGTGRARHGTTRSPLWRKGGVVFGPHPRSYAQRMPRKMWRLAVSCLLSDKVREQNLVVVNELGLERPKAKEVLQLLQSLGVSSSSLLVTRGRDLVLAKSANNLERVKVVGLHQVRIQDLTKFDTVVITADALRGAEEAWARKGPKGKRGQVVQV